MVVVGTGVAVACSSSGSSGQEGLKDSRQGPHTPLLSEGGTLLDIFNLVQIARLTLHGQKERLEIGSVAKYTYGAWFSHSTKLQGEPAEWFPMRFHLDNKLVNAALTRLPKGFHLAPVIAQRSSDAIVKRATYWMEKMKIDGVIYAWVDNFIVFAHSTSDVNRIMEILQKQLRAVAVKCNTVCIQAINNIKESSGLPYCD